MKFIDSDKRYKTWPNTKITWPLLRNEAFIRTTTNHYAFSAYKAG